MSRIRLCRRNGKEQFAPGPRRNHGSLPCLFGSRAKGGYRSDSDIDLAVVLTEDANDTAAGFSSFEGSPLEKQLAAVLPVKLDLQFAFPDDTVVWPAVLDHGILLYSAHSYLV